MPEYLLPRLDIGIHSKTAGRDFVAIRQGKQYTKLSCCKILFFYCCHKKFVIVIRIISLITTVFSGFRCAFFYKFFFVFLKYYIFTSNSKGNGLSWYQGFCHLIFFCLILFCLILFYLHFFCLLFFLIRSDINLCKLFSQFYFCIRTTDRNHSSFQNIRISHKSGNITGSGVIVDFVWRTDLLKAAFIHHHNPI